MTAKTKMNEDTLAWMHGQVAKGASLRCFRVTNKHRDERYYIAESEAQARSFALSDAFVRDAANPIVSDASFMLSFDRKNTLWKRCVAEAIRLRYVGHIYLDGRTGHVGHRSFPVPAAKQHG